MQIRSFRSFSSLSFKTPIDVTHEFVKKNILEHGHIRLAGTGFGTPDNFSKQFRHLVGQPMEYLHGTQKREKIGQGVLNVGPDPPCVDLPHHNEMSYADSWPQLFMIACIQPASPGTGLTPIANNRKITQAIPIHISDKAMEVGIKYVRNFTNKDLLDKIGENSEEAIIYKSWQDVFFTDNKDEVEKQCKEQNIDFTWRDGDRLTTSYLRPAYILHPETGETLYFNQAYLFREHFSDQYPHITPYLRPNHAQWGDGSEISSHELRTLAKIYHQFTIYYPWNEGDIVILDNHLWTHSRTPYDDSDKDKRKMGLIIGTPVQRINPTQTTGISKTKFA